MLYNTNQLESIKTPMKLTIDAGNYYLRGKFNDSKDIVTKFVTSAEVNSLFNLRNTFLVDKYISHRNIASAITSLQYIQNSGDEITPWRLNDSTVGGNHGHYQAIFLNATAHGKTIADVGSEWKDTANTHWFIVKIIDANSLLVVSAYTLNNGVPTFSITFSGTTLVHVSNATNTTTITISNVTYESTSGMKSTKNHQCTIMLDDILDINTLVDGVYNCDSLIVRESYEITSLSSVLDYIKSRIGYQSTFDEAPIESVAKIENIYRFLDPKTCIVTTTFTSLKNVKLMDNGMLQASTLNKYYVTGGRVFTYIPNTLPISSVNFENILEINNTAYTITSAYHKDINNPPNRAVILLRQPDGITPIVGFEFGYDLLNLSGQPSIRKNNINYSYTLSANNKVYPYCFSDESVNYSKDYILPPGVTIAVTGYRVFFDNSLTINATAAICFEYDRNIYVILDYHTNVTGDIVQLPLIYRGRNIDIVQKNNDFTLVDNIVSNEGSFKVTTINNLGWAVLKLR